jgi:hypothetical protein
MRTHIFCTNIHSKEQLEILEPHLNTHCNIIRWSIDLEDIDAVLKVITTHHLEDLEIIQLLASKGYDCKVMTD